jgi:replicative DNA helicase
MVAQPQQQRKRYVSAGRATQQIMEQARERKKNPTHVWGIPWGFPALDKKTGGIQKEEMTVLIARPGVGKSALAGQIGCNVGEYFKKQASGLVVRVISLEMSAVSWQKRMASYKSGVAIHKVNSGFITDEELDRFERASNEIAQLPIEYIDDNISLDFIKEFVERKGNCGFWILDYIGIIGSMDPKASWASLTGAAHELRELSKRVAPSLILSQMNRKSEERQDKRPTLADISGADGIGADARRVFGLYREDIYQRMSEEDRKQPMPAELLILKANNGSLGNIDMIFNPPRVEWIEAQTDDEASV